MRTYFKLFFLLSGLILFSCDQEKQKPDVSHINLDIKIERFDQDFSKMVPQNIITHNTEWLKKYGDFYIDFMMHMLQVGSPADTLHMQRMLSTIVQQKDFKALSNAVNEKFPNLSKQEKELTQAFKYLIYYFPDYKVPRFISFFAGFAVQVPIGQDYIGIGLDMFMGADSPFYPALVQSIPLYVSRRFAPEYIVPRIVETALREEILPEPLNEGNTLQKMIYNGKVLYAMDCLLDVPDSLKIGYTAEQMKWSEHYQKDIWSWFLEEDLLYSTDYLRTQKYFSEAPFSPELGKQNESAPKLGSFIGWQIIRHYMERNPKVSLKELFEQHDAQLILESSKYKGKA